MQCGSLFKPIVRKLVVPYRRHPIQSRVARLQKFKQIAVPTARRVGGQNLQRLLDVVGQQRDRVKKSLHAVQILRANPSALKNFHAFRLFRQRLTALHGASAPCGAAGGDFRLMAHRVQMLQQERTFIQAAAVGDQMQRLPMRVAPFPRLFRKADVTAQVASQIKTVIATPCIFHLVDEANPFVHGRPYLQFRKGLLQKLRQWRRHRHDRLQMDIFLHGLDTTLHRPEKRFRDDVPPEAGGVQQQHAVNVHRAQPRQIAIETRRIDAIREIGLPHPGSHPRQGEEHLRHEFTISRHPSGP